MNFLSSKKITTLFSKGAFSLLSTTFVSSFVLLSFLPQHFSFVASQQKSYFQSSLVFSRFAANLDRFTSIFDTIKNVAKNVTKATLNVVGKVLDTVVPGTTTSIKKATTTTATTFQKVIALGSVGGGMALIALLFFFIL